MNLARRAFLILCTFIFTACTMETGSVIEFKLSRSADPAVIEEVLQIVASEMGMVIEGPESGLGGIVEYRASYPSESSTPGFFISIVLGDQRSVLIRTMNTQVVDSAIAERALELFQEEFGTRGIKFDLRRGR